jgi:nitrate reductase alpha subunit
LYVPNNITNGQVAVKAWAALGKITGRDHTHLAKPKEDEKIRFIQKKISLFLKDLVF